MVTAPKPTTTTNDLWLAISNRCCDQRVLGQPEVADEFAIGRTARLHFEFQDFNITVKEGGHRRNATTYETEHAVGGRRAG